MKSIRILNNQRTLEKLHRLKIYEYFAINAKKIILKKGKKKKAHSGDMERRTGNRTKRYPS